MKMRHTTRRLNSSTLRIGTLLACALIFGWGCGQPAEQEASTDSGNLGASDGPAWFEEVAAQRGLDFVYHSGRADSDSPFLMPEIMGGAPALFDFDNDGHLDLYLLQGGALDHSMESRPPNRLFRNRGDGTFVDVTEGSGADHRGYAMGVATADYDNDGDVDLFVTNVGPNALLRNDGDGRFTEVARQAGVDDERWGAGASFLDYDADGDLDLYVANYLHWSIEAEIDCFHQELGVDDYCSPLNYSAPTTDLLYRNNGDGTFTDVTTHHGIAGAVGTGLGTVAGDFNGDGRLGVFVANDGLADRLWSARADGVLIDVAGLTGTAVDFDGTPKAGMGVAAEDIDDDGDLDLLVGNLHNQIDSFYRNEGGFFLDVTARSGLGPASRPFTRFGLGFRDFDNDGRLDLYQANGRVRLQSDTYLEERVDQVRKPASGPVSGQTDDPYAEPDQLFQGLGEGRLSPVSILGALPETVATSRGVAFGDIDSDGGVDIVVVDRDGPVRLLRNTVEERGHWIRLRVLDSNGRDALGATVRIRLGERTVTRVVRTDGSYLSASDPRVHIGLGAQATVDDIQVTYATGETQSFGSQTADQDLTLRAGEGQTISGR